MNSDILTLDEAAAVLGVTPRRLQGGHWGPPRMKGYGSQVRYHREDLKAWIAQNRGMVCPENQTQTPILIDDQGSQTGTVSIGTTEKTQSTPVSGCAGKSSDSHAKQQILNELRSKLAASVPKGNRTPVLVAVEGGLGQ